MGDYGYLEAIGIMEKEKEYWEGFHKSRQEARAWAKVDTKLQVGVILHSLFTCSIKWINWVCQYNIREIKAIHWRGR